jgi:hypothetical protein
VQQQGLSRRGVQLRAGRSRRGATAEAKAEGRRQRGAASGAPTPPRTQLWSERWRTLQPGRQRGNRAAAVEVELLALPALARARALPLAWPSAAASARERSCSLSSRLQSPKSSQHAGTLQSVSQIPSPSHLPRQPGAHSGS